MDGRTFAQAQGAAQWKYRLESQGIPDGPMRLMVKAVFADDAIAVSQTVLRLDNTPPQLQLLSPREEGRLNAEIALTGTAADENGVERVRVAVRKGHKASYEVPGFIQGLYFDAHMLGAVVGQLEFPIVKIKTWPIFNTWSLYTEYQLWFISSDVSAGFVNRLSFGLRLGVF
jgi:hypothetical protein